MKYAMLLLLAATPGWAAGAPVPDRAERDAQAGLFLSAARELNRAVDAGPNPVAERRLRELDAQAALAAANDDTPLADRYYLAGYRAWRASDAERARNEWVKFAELTRRGGAGDPGRMKEVNEHLNLARLYLAEKRRTEESERARIAQAQMPVAAPPPITRPPRRKKRDKKKDEARFNASVREVGRLMKKAAAAESDGQLEYADRLYRLVLRIDPASASAKDRQAALRKRMR
jgi:hypothetical protein